VTQRSSIRSEPSLIGIYFVILVLSWVYIYYIEFLGRDLVVVG